MPRSEPPIAQAWLDDLNASKLKLYQPTVSDIQQLEHEISSTSDDDLRRRTPEFTIANPALFPTS